jgi:hypothetical protein
VPVSASWRDLVDGEDRKRALRAMEACAITGLRKALRRGTVWISHSLSFRERDQLLIPPTQWESGGTGICPRSVCRTRLTPTSTASRII